MKRTRNYEVIEEGTSYTRSFGSLRAAREFIKRQLTPSPNLRGWRIMWLHADSTQIIKHKVTGKIYQPYPRDE